MFNFYMHSSEKYETVKIGFSWPGFFFQAICVIITHLWLIGFLLLAANIIDRAEASETTRRKSCCGESVVSEQKHSSLAREDLEAFLVGKRDLPSLICGKNVDINANVPKYGIPLHSATGRKTCNNTIPELLACGANPNLKDDEGKTALHLLAYNELDLCEKGLLALFDAGLNVNEPDKEGKTALHHAAGISSISEFFLMHGAKVNAQDRDGNTPLFYAIVSGDLMGFDAIQVLLQNGADLTLRNKRGESPYSWLASAPEKYEHIRQQLQKFLKKNNAEAQIQKEPVTTLNIIEAIGNGLIKVEVSSAGMSALEANVNRTSHIPLSLKVIIPFGTIFINKDNNGMNMISIKESVLDLSLKKNIWVMIPAVSINAFKESRASTSFKFDIFGFQTENLNKLLNVLKKKLPNEIVIPNEAWVIENVEVQLAVWIVTDDVSLYFLNEKHPKEVKWYPRNRFANIQFASDEEILKALQMVDEAGINIVTKVIFKEVLFGERSEQDVFKEFIARVLKRERKDRFEILMIALQDKNSYVRWITAKQLVELKDSRTVEPLITALTDESIRMEAASALGNIKDTRAVEPLIALLKDKEWKVRQTAALALGKINDIRAIEPLIYALKDEHSYVRKEAAHALGILKDSRAVLSLIEALDDEPIASHNAVIALGEIRDPRAVKPLIAFMRKFMKKIGGGYFNFEDVSSALVKIGPPSVEPLISVLNDESWCIRSTAVDALGRLKDTRAIHPLISAMKDENLTVRREAADAINKIGWTPANQNEKIIYLIATNNWGEIVKIGTQAVEALITALVDKDSNVRGKAADALDKIGWRPANQKEETIYLIAAQKWDAVVKVGAPAIEPLITALGYEESDVRRRVVDILGKIKDVRAVEPLIVALKDEDWDVRSKAVEVFNAIGTPAVELLIKALRDDAWEVRVGAVEALGKIGDRRAVYPLITVLGDEDEGEFIRESAAEALNLITGQTFGENPAKWQKWWEKNKVK